MPPWGEIFFLSPGWLGMAPKRAGGSDWGERSRGSCLRLLPRDSNKYKRKRMDGWIQTVSSWAVWHVFVKMPEMLQNSSPFNHVSIALFIAAVWGVWPCPFFFCGVSICWNWFYINFYKNREFNNMWSWVKEAGCPELLTDWFSDSGWPTTNNRVVMVKILIWTSLQTLGCILLNA